MTFLIAGVQVGVQNKFPIVRVRFSPHPGLWERWYNPAGEIVHSYSMLTVNADNHEFMRNYHKREDEKWMVVILPKGLYMDWLDALAHASADFMCQYPADRLSVS